MAKKTIPCKVCGKQFEPCGYCQKHGDVFRWRNFACSLECANKYIAEAIAYREKNNKVEEITQPVEEKIIETVIEPENKTKTEDITVEESIFEEIPVAEAPKKMKKRNYNN